MIHGAASDYVAPDHVAEANIFDSENEGAAGQRSDRDRIRTFVTGKA